MGFSPLNKTGQCGTFANFSELSALHRIVPWYSIDFPNSFVSVRQRRTRAKNAGFFMDLAKMVAIIWANVP